MNDATPLDPHEFSTEHIIERLEDVYDFECEGGPLKNCIEWQILKERIVMGVPCPLCGEEAVCCASFGGQKWLQCFACKANFAAPKPPSVFDDQRHYHGCAVRVGHCEPKESCPACK